MKNIAIFNLGNRDLYFTEPVEILGENIEGPLPNYSNSYSYRELSQYMMDHYDTYKEKISFPIIEHTLTRIHKQDKAKIHEIYLFATDQLTKHPTDTIFTAKILQRYLLDLKRDKEWKNFFDELKKPIIRVTSEVPADLDRMNDFYSKELERIVTKDLNKAFISITGGTPAMNNMVLLNGIKYFKNKAQVLYLPRESNRPVKIQFGKMLLKENIVETIKDNITIYDYYAALNHLQHHREEFENRKSIDNLQTLLLYAHNRMTYNFDLAEEYIGELLDNVPRKRREIEELYDQIHDLYDNVHEHIDRYMAELYWNMWSLYQKGQFIDVCSRIFRFLEEGMKQILTVNLNVPVKDHGKYLDQQWLAENPELTAFLQSYKQAGPNGIDYQRTITRMTIQAIIDFYIEKGVAEVVDVTGRINAIEKLATLRNQSPSAHGFIGVSEEKMYEAVNDSPYFNVELQDFQATLFENFRAIYIAIFGDDILVQENIYKNINILLFDFVRELE